MDLFWLIIWLVMSSGIMLLLVVSVFVAIYFAIKFVHQKENVENSVKILPVRLPEHKREIGKSEIVYVVQHVGTRQFAAKVGFTSNIREAFTWDTVEDAIIYTEYAGSREIMIDAAACMGPSIITMPPEA